MVYEASEDTVLLLKGVTMLAPGSTRACEIGCGSGIVTLTLTPYAERTLATDIDVGAVAATWSRARSSGVDDKVDVVCCDRVEAVREGFKFDLIAFNPPYLPVEGEDVSWSGGRRGIEAAMRFAESGVKRLSERGKMVFVLSSLSAWRDMLRELLERGFRIGILSVEHVGLYEDLLLVVAGRRYKNV